MAFQSAPNIAEAVINGIMGAKTMVNVFNFFRPGGYDQNDIDDLAILVDDTWSTNVLPLLYQSYAYSNTLVRGLELLNDRTAIEAGGAGSGGVASGGSCPSNVAYCVTHRTDFTGRSARGRTYLAGIPNAGTASVSAVTSTFRNAVNAAFEQMRQDFLASNWDWVVLSRVTLGAARAFGIGFPIVTTEARNDLLDSQRNRLPAGH